MIYIVIPVFNRSSFTRACLHSLRRQFLISHKVIVVDHGSSDNTSEMIEAEFPEVLLVKGNESMWWAGATNAGVRMALSVSKDPDDLVLTLNNDLEVDPDYLDELVRVFEINKPCLAGSASVDIQNPDKFSFIGVSWNSYTARYKPNNAIRFPAGQFIRQLPDIIGSDLLPGRGTLIPILAFRALGLYDEINFPHYAADEDFSLRCRKAGYSLVIAKKAVIRSYVHEIGQNKSLPEMSPLQFCRSLGATHSVHNLRTRYRWARQNSAMPLFYFGCSIIRILGSYVKARVIKTKPDSAHN
jgi:GT2 family glycosyltransferase